MNTEGLKPTGGAEVLRRGMTPDELTVIFQALAKHRHGEPHKLWVPALAAYKVPRVATADVDALILVDVLGPSGRLGVNHNMVFPAETLVAVLLDA